MRDLPVGTAYTVWVRRRRSRHRNAGDHAVRGVGKYAQGAERGPDRGRDYWVEAGWGIAYRNDFWRSEANEAGRLPGRYPACPCGRAHASFHQSGSRSNLALRLRTSKATTRAQPGNPSIRPSAYSGRTVVGRRAKNLTATATATELPAASQKRPIMPPPKTKRPAKRGVPVPPKPQLTWQPSTQP